MSESKKAAWIEERIAKIITTSAEDIATARERLAREYDAEEGLCSACGAPVMPHAIEERREWALSHLSAFAATARAHGSTQSEIVRAVGGALVDMLRVDVRELDAVMRRSVEPVLEELRSKLDLALDKLDAEEEAPTRGKLDAEEEEAAAEAGELVDWVGFVQSGEMTARELNEYVQALHIAHADRVERVREEERDAAAREYDERTARACAQLEEEIEELRKLLALAKLDASARGEAAEEALARSLAPIVEERRRQRVKYNAEHDAKNGAASWAATLLALVGSYGSALYGYDHGESRELRTHNRSRGRALLARIGAVAAAAIEADDHKLDAEEADRRYTCKDCGRLVAPPLTMGACVDCCAALREGDKG